MEIEKQKELGEEGLLEEERFWLNEEDLETVSGERHEHEYWLLAVKATRQDSNPQQQYNKTIDAVATTSYSLGIQFISRIIYPYFP